jgi:hypothetical protein
MGNPWLGKIKAQRIPVCLEKIKKCRVFADFIPAFLYIIGL